jgi:FixJ family two-component response regulator
MSSVHHVYIIDDDLSVRNGLSRLLRTAGYDVHTYSSADEFLAAPDIEPIGCIILDARMPGLSGPELQAELSDRGRELPLIFVTADDDPEIRKKAMALHAAGFFRKPVDGAALLDAVKWTISRETIRSKKEPLEGTA